MYGLLDTGITWSGKGLSHVVKELWVEIVDLYKFTLGGLCQKFIKLILKNTSWDQTVLARWINLLAWENNTCSWQCLNTNPTCSLRVTSQMHLPPPVKIVDRHTHAFCSFLSPHPTLRHHLVELGDALCFQSGWMFLTEYFCASHNKLLGLCWNFP